MNSGQESKSTIIDNINSLSNTPINTIDNSIDQSNQKTYTVTDIVNKRINSLENYLDSKVMKHAVGPTLGLQHSLIRRIRWWTLPEVTR